MGFAVEDRHLIKCLWVSKSYHHHHHHRQPWAQCPLVSDAIVTIAPHHCLSSSAWLNSCRVAPHHCSMSSDHSRWGRPLLFEPSIIPNTRVFIFLLSFILQICPRGATFSVSLSAVGFLSIESFCTILHPTSGIAKVHSLQKSYLKIIPVRL